MATTVRSGAERRLINRELSWLEYNARLLELAADEAVPLLERVKICRFFSHNLDEFFMVRVAGLLGQAARGSSFRSADGLTPRARWPQIRERVLRADRQSKLWKRSCGRRSPREDRRSASVEECTPRRAAELEARFEREIFPVLTPLGVGPGSRSRTSPGSRSASASSHATPRPARSASRASRCPRACRASSPSAARPAAAARDVIAHFLTVLFPGWRSSSAPSSA